MKLSKQKILITIAVLMLVVVVMAGCTPQEKKMGVVDMNRVIKESPKAQDFQNQLDEKGAKVQEEYKAIDEKDISDEEKQQEKRVVLEDFVKEKSKIESSLNKEIEKAVKQVAEDQKIDIVFYKQSVHYGGTDITDEVINLLQ